MKSRLAEEWKAAGKLQDSDKLGVNPQDNRQERLEEGHRLEREEEEVQDRGDESQDNGDARDRPDDLQEGEDGPAQTPAPLNARRAIVPRTIQTDAPTLPLPGMRMSAEEVAKAIRNGQMVSAVV